MMLHCIGFLFALGAALMWPALIVAVLWLIHLNVKAENEKQARVEAALKEIQEKL